jgi:DNA-binding Xre family transcriptional regulator
MKKGADQMGFSYNKLWKILIDKGMNKTELRKKTGIGTATLAKLSANEKVSLDVIEKICLSLQVQPADIMEYIPDKTDNQQ